MAVGTAVQVYVGVEVPIVPVGARSPLTAGGTPSAGTMKPSPLLQGPYPALFQVCTHQVAAPGARRVLGVTLHVPPPQPRAVAGYHWVTLPEPLASLTQRQYQVAVGTAVQV